MQLGSELSAATTWASPSVRESGISDTLSLVPVHISSVLSVLSLSRLAAIHCSMTETHCCMQDIADGVFWLTVNEQLIVVSVNM